jgi:hypothetical protein
MKTPQHKRIKFGWQALLALAALTLPACAQLSQPGYQPPQTLKEWQAQPRLSAGRPK